MKFRFALQTLLKQRKALENRAMKEFLEARSKLDRCLSEISDIYSGIDRARVFAHQIQEGGGHAIELLRLSDEFTHGQKLRVEQKKTEARTQMSEVEDRQEVLVEASRERKTIEKLKEKRKEKFDSDQQKKTDREVDDMNIMRFRRGEEL